MVAKGSSVLECVKRAEKGWLFTKRVMEVIVSPAHPLLGHQYTTASISGPPVQVYWVWLGWASLPS